MSHAEFKEEDTQAELNALRETLPAIIADEKSEARYPVAYSLDLAKRVCDSYAQGESIAQIARKSAMPPYGTLLKWAKTHPELSKMLRAVREARALHFEGAALDAAEAAQGKDADRLKVDTYIWAAGINDPETYGKKVTHAGDSAAPIVLQVVTGFGPPNAWQTPPKLKADGTIDKDASTIKDVEAQIQEVAADDPGRHQRSHEGGNEEAHGPSGAPGEAGPPHVAGSGGNHQLDGATPLPVIEGHPADDGSP